MARRANREEGCTGRAWEGSFKCEKLELKAAIIACMAYIDLTLVSAGMATAPELSIDQSTPPFEAYARPAAIGFPAFSQRSS
jgi:hypothetical protein